MTTQITVYQTDSTGLFVHAAVAHELPLAPGTYNVPHGALIVPPPLLDVGQAALAVGESWIVVPDHRADTLYRVDTGEPYSVGTAVTVDGQVVRYPGFGQLPGWLTLIAPDPVSAQVED